MGLGVPGGAPRLLARGRAPSFKGRGELCEQTRTTRTGPRTRTPTRPPRPGAALARRRRDPFAFDPLRQRLALKAVQVTAEHDGAPRGQRGVETGAESLPCVVRPCGQQP